jgi:hypothetical protein
MLPKKKRKKEKKNFLRHAKMGKKKKKQFEEKIQVSKLDSDVLGKLSSSPWKPKPAVTNMIRLQWAKQTTCKTR